MRFATCGNIWERGEKVRCVPDCPILEESREAKPIDTTREISCEALFLSTMSENDMITRRWTVVAFWRDGESSPATIRKETGESYDFIRRTLERWKETGTVTDRPRRGRPRIEIDARKLRRLKTKATPSTRTLAKTLSTEGTIKVSKNTVWRRAKEMGMRSRVKPKRPRLTNLNREQRLAFANQARERGYWKRVVAVDEKTVPLFSDMRIEWV